MTRLDNFAKNNTNPNIRNVANVVNQTEYVNGAALKKAPIFYYGEPKPDEAVLAQQQALQEQQRAYDEQSGAFGPDYTNTGVSQQVKDNLVAQEQARTITPTPDQEVLRRQNAQYAYTLNNLSPAVLQELYNIYTAAGGKNNYSTLTQWLNPTEYNRVLFGAQTKANYDTDNDGQTDWLKFENGNYTLEQVKKLPPQDQLVVFNLAKSYLAYIGNKLNIANVYTDLTKQKVKAARKAGKDGLSRVTENKVKDAKQIVDYVLANNNANYSSYQAQTTPIDYNVTLADSNTDAATLSKLYKDLVAVKNTASEYNALQWYLGNNNTALHEIDSRALQSKEQATYLQKQLSDTLAKVIAKVKTDPHYTYETLSAYYDTVAADPFTSAAVRNTAAQRAAEYRQRILPAREIAKKAYYGRG